ncbi:MAG: TIGR01777 family oxidoreductase [Acidimicrobiales bacterium]
MRVLISGSTGLIGEALVRGLLAADHEPVRLVRSHRPDDLPAVSWDPAAGTIDDDALDGIDAVIHLAGEGIAEHRWSDAQKARILDSRVEGTSLLADRIAAAATPPSVFISGSAIGFYGDRGDERLTETSEPGEGFLADVVAAWEGATAPVTTPPTRVVHIRTGIVLSGEGGALAPQLPFFKAGLGGRIGSGNQWWSWISIDDMVGALLWLLTNDVHGAVNLTAPNPVTNGEFTKVLGRVLHRPTLLPIPKPALWLRLGRELTEALLYASQRVEPTVLSDRGYEFEHPDIEGALRAVLDRPD